MEISKSDIGDILIEGKTKQVYSFKSSNAKHRNHVYILSKDRITAGDGAKSHTLVGKSILSTQTNCAIFEYLNAIGIRTHFVSRVAESNPDSKRSFIAKRCSMIPIEWVCRRIATGSFLRRHPHVPEGYRFAPLKLETFYKDDANHDPFWSEETLIGAKLNIGDMIITADHVQEMYRVTNLVFEVLERAWQTVNHSLIDMKIEFGVYEENGIKQIVVADVIDNDSWRLWPNGEKRLMLDKQVYRNMDNSKIDEDALNLVKANFEIVAERTQKLFNSLIPTKPDMSKIEGVVAPTVAIVVGSPSDKEYAMKIKDTLMNRYKIYVVDVHVASAHKSTQKTLEMAAKILQWPSCKVVVAIAGMSNGLGPVLAANLPIPVISTPPTTDVSILQADIWSSLRIPSGMSTGTVIGADNAAIMCANIVGTSDAFVWSTIRTFQTYQVVRLIHSKI
ncbi:PAICS bifunctional enzyme [Dermatophagoides farinae]|uniref:PAICS bifunctional enzyme n=1 Tax=Dermatophagoides farinae TaxID=6954 RepID=UPI003F61C97B